MELDRYNSQAYAVLGVDSSCGLSRVDKSCDDDDDSLTVRVIHDFVKPTLGRLYLFIDWLLFK